MKKLFLLSLFILSFATLSAAASPLASRPMNYQDARNYCNDIGMHIATLNQLKTLCGQDGWVGFFWTLEGTTFSPNACTEVKASKNIYSNVLCARN